MHNKPKTSSRIDRISNKLIEFVKAGIAPLLTDIFNEIVEQGLIPDVLKHAKVLPLFQKIKSF